MGEKSVRLKKQFRARVTIDKWEGKLDFFVIPKLAQECILGVGAQRKLKLLIDFDKEVISFGRITENGEIEVLKKNIHEKIKPRTEINSIKLRQNEQDNTYDLDKTDDMTEPLMDDEISEADIDAKLSEIDEITLEQRNRLKNLIIKRFEPYEYTLRFDEKTPYFHKSYPIPLKYLEKVDLEIERMLRYDIIERSYSQFINPLVPVIKRNGSIRLCLNARELNKRLQNDHDGPEGMDEVLRKCAKVG